MHPIESRIKSLVLQEFENTNCFIVDVSVSAMQHIQVFIDCPENISIDRCVKISRLLEQHLEEEGLVGEKYKLDVSSPGMENPIKVLQQYHKYKGRELDVKMNDGTRINGLLHKADEYGIVLEQRIKISKKTFETELVDLKFDDFLEARLVIKFKK